MGLRRGHVDDLAFRSGSELVASLRRREVSSRELLDIYLDRIDRLNPDVNAVVTIDAERARREADAADKATMRGDADGALHGLPMTVKDSIETAGLRTTAGAAELADHVPTVDAPAVARLRAAGAVVFGKTNLPAWAGDCQTFNELFGTTNNPWDTTRTPGGSSGGSAAAVAAGTVPWSIGTDTGGSIRQPAALCGIVGLKPTYGAISRYGMIAFASSLDQAGPFTRDTTDAALLLQAMAGKDPCDSTALGLPEPVRLPTATDLQGIRLGVPEELSGEGIEPGVLKAFQ
jgi:Asp-tRNA(Asn)/Glu-tRNA(Gln) amidotransferase A subunit family amidase